MEFQDEILAIIRKYWLPSSLGLIAVIFLGYGLISSSSSLKSDQIQEFVPEKPTSQAEIAVDVEGAVVSPGVYKLKEGQLNQDAINAAGGFSADEDTEWVAKNLNLALKVTDGEKIYIPKEGEAAVADQSSADEVSGLININTATESELDSLPGVGSVTAGKIIDGRPYTSIDELLDKKIVGNSEFEKIKDLIRT